MSVPTLRFPEFEGEWEEKRLGEIAKVVDCKHRTPIYVEEGIPVVSPGSIDWGELDLVSPTKRVTEADYLSLMDHCEPKANDLVMSRNQSVGISSKVKTDEPFVLGQDTVLIQSLSVESLFLYNRFQTEATQNNISKTSGGSTFSRINLKDIRRLQIPVSATLPEQKKIAAFLGVVDEKLAALRARRAGLETYKRGLMQKLFSPTLRFTKPDGSAFPDWEEKRLGELATVKTGSRDTQDRFEDGIYPFYVRSDTIERINSFAFDGEAILTSGDGVGVGRNFHYVVGKFDYHQRVYAIYEFKENVLGTYIYMYFSSHFLKRVMRLSAKNSVDSVRMSMITDMPIPLPHPDEQRLIADTLQAMDAKIQTVTDQITRTEAFKNGLLQQMFV